MSFPIASRNSSDLLRLDGPGIESRWGREFPHLSTPALVSTHSPVQFVPGIFSVGKTARAWLGPPTPV